MKRKQGVPERTYLTLDKTSWFDTMDAPKDIWGEDMLEQLLALRPAERGEIKMFGRMQLLPRTSKSYGMDYRYSGVNHEADPFPKCVRDVLDWANQTEWAKEGNWKFSQALINWYMDGAQYISDHSDDEKQLEVREEETLIMGISWGETRSLVLKPKKTTVGGVMVRTSLLPNMVYVMGGRCQRTHTHGIPKAGGQHPEKIKPRVSITLRCFKKE